MRDTQETCTHELLRLRLPRVSSSWLEAFHWLKWLDLEEKWDLMKRTMRVYSPGHNNRGLTFLDARAGADVPGLSFLVLKSVDMGCLPWNLPALGSSFLEPSFPNTGLRGNTALPAHNVSVRLHAPWDEGSRRERSSPPENLLPASNSTWTKHPLETFLGRSFRQNNQVNRDWLELISPSLSLPPFPSLSPSHTHPAPVLSLSL